MTDPKDIAVASARLEEDLTLYALSDGNTPARRALFDQAAEASLAQAREQLAEAVKVISSLVAHHDALAEGPTAHHLGCGCGGSPDGIHCCRSLEEAFKAAAELHAKLTGEKT